MMQGGSMALRVAATQQLRSDSQGDHSSYHLTQQHNNRSNSSSSGVPMDLSSGGCLGGLSGKLSYQICIDM
jgi:hypothetical protein